MSVDLLGELCFWAFLVLAALAGGAAWVEKKGPARLLGGLALATGVGLAACIWAQTGRPPFSGAYESLIVMALVLACLSLRSLFSREANCRLAALSWLATAFLLAILIIVPRQTNPNWFVYRFFFSRAFFMLRLVAMAVLLYSSLAALSWPGGNRDPVIRRTLTARSRRFLLLGTALFLLGEVSGFYWCLSWRGDYWLWNRNFLESTMIFLLSSAALHLPPRLAASPRGLRLAYSLPGLLATVSFLVHRISEAYLLS